MKTSNVLRKYVAELLIALVIVVQVCIAWSTVLSASPTSDEAAHLLSGVVQFSSGDTRYFEVNPPVVRWLSAALVVSVFGDVRIPMSTGFTEESWRRIEFHQDNAFIDANAEHFMEMLMLGRLVPGFIMVAGTLLVALVSKHLWGTASGVASAALWAFCPSIIGYGPLLSMDVSGAVVLIFAIWLWWYEMHVRNLPRVWALALVFASLTLIKFTLLPLLVLLPAIYIAGKLLSAPVLDRKHVINLLCRVSVAVLVSLFVINLAYGFDRFGWKLKDFNFYSSLGGGKVDAPSNPWRETVLADFRVPLPAAVLIGIDEQKVDFETGLGKNYLLGEWSMDGWYSYYFVGLLTKLPEATLFLACMSVIACRSITLDSRQKWLATYLVASGMVLFVLVSSQTKLNQHFRYSMPSVAVLIIMSTATMATASRYVRALSMSLLAIAVVTGVYHKDHALSYFNYASGGIRNGPNIMSHSSIDWGQDLFKIRDWLENNSGKRPVHLYIAHTGFDLRNFGIDAETVIQKSLNRSPGITMGSATRLGSGYHIVSWQHVLDPDSPYYEIRSNVLERIGCSYVVFHVEHAN